MKKILSIPVIFIIFTAALLLTWRCSDDNPVTTPPPEPPYEYDSARFDWKVDTLYGQGFYYGLWAADTNEIFIPNIFTNVLVHIKNGIKTYSYYTKERPVGAIFGDELNKGYRAGAILIDSLYQPLIQKWDGNSFVDISNPLNLDRNFFYWTGFIKNSTEMWFGLTDGNLIKFDGSTFTVYPLYDSRIKSLKFFYDESNKFKLLASIHHLDIDQTEFLIYEFTGSQWVKVFNDKESPRPLRYVVLNKYVSANNRITIFELIDSLLAPKINIVPNATQFSMDGFSFDNILVPGQGVIGDCYTTLFHWNGSKWSVELCGYWVDPLTDVFMINENYYYAITHDPREITFVMRGIKKFH
ncbi:MAG: hypothetical protein IPM38_15105 [Ignavibacteria bacterium]|nr:hypothetical protein [Ignavibacteria bacterium]